MENKELIRGWFGDVGNYDEATVDMAESLIILLAKTLDEVDKRIAESK